VGADLRVSERVINVNSALNATASSDIADRLAKMPFNERLSLAWSDETHADVLIRLADDDYWKVRMGVAAHKSTPAEALARLSADEKEPVRWWVSLHPLTPSYAIKRLSRDPSERIRKAVEGRRSRLSQLFRR